MNICTIVAKNYIAHARVLAKSFKEHHPEGRCYVLVVDDTEGYLDPAREPFELVTPSDLDNIEDYEHMAAIYDVVELSTAVKPWLLSHLLNRRGEERIVYFDPDIRIFDRLDELEGLIKEHELVLIPHITSPLPRDGKKPSEADILIAGTYNLGFIALESCERSNFLLDWWAERLATDCVVAPEMGYFVDQRWIDFVHGVMPDFYVLRDPGYNVAYWNLHGRELTHKKGRYYVNGKPLRFFHFSGFSPNKRDRLSKHQSRIEIKRGSALARICNEYADALLESGFEKVRSWPYSYGTLPNGVKLDSGMHRLYRKGIETGGFKGKLFTPEGARRFTAWLNDPAPVGGEYGVTRYLYEIYSGRPDLREAFPNLDGPDAADFLEWARVHGEVDLPSSHHPAANDNGYRPPVAGKPTGVNVAGYFRSELGVGEVARQMTEALRTQNVPVATVGVHTAHSRQGHDYETDTVRPTYPVNLICVNADALPDFARNAGIELFENRYSVGMWWWEVNEFPEIFHNSFEYVDEVWVGSHHVADAVSRVSPVPVVKMTVPVSMPEVPKMSRRELGLPEGFLFLFSFDYHSVFERKNPLAAVEAFKKAFAPGSGASLVVKSINGDKHPEEHAKLVAAAQDHPDIHVVDRYVSFGEKNAIAAACDCYVSLHRSEGFGFTLAEPMYLGKPVIGTAYSGNMDFMTDRNSYLVDYELVPIGEGADPYPPTGEWAKPDIGHAASLMRHAFENQEEARERGKRAAEDIRRTHSPEAAGRAIARRLSHIEARVGRESQAAAAGADPRGLNIKPLSDKIGRSPELGVRPGPVGRAIAFARRVLLKFLWPFYMQQRTINDQLLTLIKNVEVQTTTNRGNVLGALSEQGRRIEDLEKRSSALLDSIDQKSEQIEELVKERVAKLHSTDRHAVRVEDLDRELEVLRQKVETARNGNPVRQTMSRLVRPFTEEQQTVNDQVFAAIQVFSKNLHMLRGKQAELRQRLEAADRLVAESRSLPYMAGSPFEVYEEAAGRVYGYTGPTGEPKSAGVYDAFEDIFRGSEGFIRDRQRCYLDLLDGREPVLDVGCGRGEFLDLLREQGIEYTGIDPDSAMIERCRRKGHQKVEMTDANTCLEKFEDDSLGAIFCAQVVEHLPYEELLRFHELSARKLKPGGLFIVETVNPHSVQALKTFWVDLTHQHPIFPEVELSLCKIHGFEKAYAFHPNGTGDVEKDRYETGEYAVVATKGTAA